MCLRKQVMVSSAPDSFTSVTFNIPAQGIDPVFQLDIRVMTSQAGDSVYIRNLFVLACHTPFTTTGKHTQYFDWWCLILIACSEIFLFLVEPPSTTSIASTLTPGTQCNSTRQLKKKKRQWFYSCFRVCDVTEICPAGSVEQTIDFDNTAFTVSLSPNTNMQSARDVLLASSTFVTIAASDVIVIVPGNLSPPVRMLWRNATVFFYLPPISKRCHYCCVV